MRHVILKLALMPQHPEHDDAAQEAFKKSFPIWSRPRRRPSPRTMRAP